MFSFFSKIYAYIQPLHYSVERRGPFVFLEDNRGAEYAVVRIDSTDNRLTIQSISKNIDRTGVKLLTEYLAENFGAKQIFVVPADLQNSFIECGFILNSADKNYRLRETSILSMQSIHSKFAEGPTEDLIFVDDRDEFLKLPAENIEQLMSTSGFLKTKIQQYKMQGHAGFELMLSHSMPFGIYDKNKQKLIAFCRVTVLDKAGNLYLGDTFVDEQAFASKAEGTTYLYRQVAKALGAKDTKYTAARVLLIAPPDRVEEFESAYFCVLPNSVTHQDNTQVLSKFSGPQAELEKVFAEEKARLEELNQTNLETPTAFHSCQIM